MLAALGICTRLRTSGTGLASGLPFAVEQLRVLRKQLERMDLASRLLPVGLRLKHRLRQMLVLRLGVRAAVLR